MGGDRAGPLLDVSSLGRPQGPCDRAKGGPLTAVTRIPLEPTDRGKHHSVLVFIKKLSASNSVFAKLLRSEFRVLKIFEYRSEYRVSEEPCWVYNCMISSAADNFYGQFG